ncbi:hypothetical protein [Flavobacterium sp. CS20]|uniref:hypothetical protein n=1 Tax=Flavobacterium sp. CS20 TaxID=2775246 RepID=UPI001B39F4D2|nr:hypothetical protein [Flavobacterium sp. CS20]QTY27007.1 hypothetical protein IGB25_14385 [Flavobacterium sp. CS20]
MQRLILSHQDYSKYLEKLDKQNFLRTHKENSVIKFWSLQHWHDLVEMPEEFLLTYNVIGKNKLAQTLITKDFKNSSIQKESKLTYTYNQIKIKTFETNKQEFFMTQLADNTIFSTSKIIIENVIRNYKDNIKTNQHIKKLYDVLSENTPSVVINTTFFSKVSKFFFTKEFSKEFLSLSDYMGFDLILDENQILFSGIVLKTQDKSHLWSNFREIKPKKSFVAEVIPSYFVSAKSLLISDYKTFTHQENLVKKTPINDSVFFDINEIAQFNLPLGKGVAMVSNDISKTYEMLKDDALPIKKFGAYQIYQLNHKLETNAELQNFIKLGELKNFVVFQDIIVGSNRLDVLEDIIIQVNNQNVLSLQQNYKNHLKSLTDQSHILWFTNLSQQKNFFEQYAQPSYKNDFKAFNWKTYGIAVTQLIVEDDFAYFNIIHKKTDLGNNQKAVKQLARLKLESTIQNTTQFFKNWRTGQYDIVYQDINNVLHLKDTKGNLIWSKPLDSPIVGKIRTIDIYKNTRLQLAFATQHKVYVLDKNGNEVDPFPLNFNNKITQSLSVFDYDNNGRYRFVVIMDNRIRMFNKQGKRVKGFQFNRTKTPLDLPLKHIRIDKKDYILAQEETGQLHILSRTGKNRVQIDKNFEPTHNEWYEHQKEFVSMSNKGQIIKINPNGDVSISSKKWINPKFVANPEIMASMSENQLYINDASAELPYGVYTNPFIKNNFVAIADLQAQKVYVFDKKANLINGFPVYGKSISDVYSKNNELILLCQDSDDAVLIYSIITE